MHDSSLGWYSASKDLDHQGPYRANKKGIFFTKPGDIVGVDLRTAKFPGLKFTRPMSFVIDGKSAQHLPDLLSSHCLECNSGDVSLDSNENVLCHQCGGMFDLAVFVDQVGYPLKSCWSARLEGRWPKDAHRSLLETPPVAISCHKPQATKAALLLARSLHLQAFAALSTNIGSGLESLGEQPQITDLSLVNVSLGEGSFSAFEKFPKLKHLNVRVNKEIGLQACRDISKLITLETLNVSTTGVDDEAMAALATLPSLTTLIVEGAKKVTDLGLAYLREHPTLERLGIGWTGVTDKGMLHLETIPNLQEVTVFDTQVSTALDERFVGVANEK